MAPHAWEAGDDEEAPEGGSQFDDYFDDPYEELDDDPYGELDDDYDDDEEEDHPLSTRQSRRQRNYRRDD